MLFARVRQLFAQFPLLVVGYSLNDPDFHLVYRHMVRCMAQRHPLGLAVLPPDGPSTSEVEVRAMRVAKRYWHRLGLRVVKLKGGATADLPATFRKVFGLTACVDRPAKIDAAFKQHSNGGVAEAFRHNVEVAEGAFADPDLAGLWTKGGARHGRWEGVVEASLPESDTETAQKRAVEYMESRRERPPVTDGTREPSERTPSTPPTPDKSRWTSVETQNGAWELLLLQRHGRLIWQIDDLLRHGVDPDILRRWLALSVEHSGILDMPGAEEATILAAAAVFGLATERFLRTVKVRWPKLYELIKGPAGVEPEVDTRPGVRRLCEAAQAALDEDRPLARRLYAEAREELRGSTERDAPLLRYFVERGANDVLFDDYRVDMPTWQDQQARLDAAREVASVRQWSERRQQMSNELRQRRLEALETLLRRGGYEASSFSFSTTGRNLYCMYRDACEMGAPISVRRELASALLGAFDSPFDELKLRIELDLKDSEHWLDALLTSGDIARPDSARPFGSAPHIADREARRRATRELGEILFPDGRPAFRGLPQRSRVRVLRECREVLRAQDLDHARGLLRGVPQDDRDYRYLETWVSLAQVYTWSDVKDDILGWDGGLLQLALRIGGQLPLQHWQTCDGFLDHGGQQLIERLVLRDRTEGGWALCTLLQTERGSEPIRMKCAEWLNGFTPSDDPEVAAALLVELQNDVGSHASAEAALHQHLQGGDHPRVELFLAGGNIHTELRSLAREKLEERARAVASASETRDALLDCQILVLDLQNRIPSATREVNQALLGRLSSTWGVLPTLAPILAREFWDEGSWKRLLGELRTGGHRGMPKSWLLQRIRLIAAALAHSKSTGTLMSEEFAFLRFAVVDGVGHGDGGVANNAAYTLGHLGRHVRADTEVRAVCSALEAVADDVRISVAHGAAFASTFLHAVGEPGGVDPRILECAKSVEDCLKDDECAIIQRQLHFGRATGAKAAHG